MIIYDRDIILSCCRTHTHTHTPSTPTQLAPVRRISACMFACPTTSCSFPGCKPGDGAGCKACWLAVPLIMRYEIQRVRPPGTGEGLLASVLLSAKIQLYFMMSPRSRRRIVSPQRWRCAVRECASMVPCVYVCVTMHVYAVATCSEKVRVLPHDTAWPSVMLPAPIFPGGHFIRLPGNTVVRVYAGGVETMHVDAQTPACWQWLRRTACRSDGTPLRRYWVLGGTLRCTAG
eukprot:SAG25_NODE_161_length_13366_cov_13.111973_14_plen_232_part_00